jgi:hypothetical protein
MKEKIKLSLEIIFLIFSVVWIWGAYIVLTEKPESVYQNQEINPDGWYG